MGAPNFPKTYGWCPRRTSAVAESDGVRLGSSPNTPLLRNVLHAACAAFRNVSARECTPPQRGSVAFVQEMDASGCHAGWRQSDRCHDAFASLLSELVRWGLRSSPYANTASTKVAVAHYQLLELKDSVTSHRLRARPYSICWPPACTEKLDAPASLQLLKMRCSYQSVCLQGQAPALSLQ